MPASKLSEGTVPSVIISAADASNGNGSGTDPSRQEIGNFAFQHARNESQ